MKLTVEHLLELFSEINPGIPYEYVSGNGNRAQLISVDAVGKKVTIARVLDNGEIDKSTSLNLDSLSLMASRIVENTPITIDFALNNNGNTRSVYEAILIRTSEFYKCTIGKSKHIVWIPSLKHKSGELIEIAKEDIPNNRSFVLMTSEQFPFTGKYIPYLTALRTKPFMLLAGISGTGKSRIVREMAKACWKEGDEEYGKNNPRNFCMVQVKPNWHDSTELMGYVTRINGEKYVVGPFLRFLAAAIKEPDVPYFLCLDEMNLAPVEQYFAEYLSVIESRKLNEDGTITTDPIIKFVDEPWYHSLIAQIFDEKDRMDARRLTIPQNLFVVGTVNMDETTFSFSRKVLDRAMTIEMNEVDLHGGLERGTGNEIGYIGNSIIGNAAEGCDIYEDNKELCDQVLAYLVKVNEILEGTPFKIAYRTRNEFLMYAVNRQKLAPESQLWQTLDEMTSMKILSRIEGDSDRTEKPLTELKKLVEEHIVNVIPTPEDGSPKPTSITATKIDEMLAKLKATSFTSYWT